MTGGPPDGGNPVVPFLLAGPQPDRTRWEGLAAVAGGPRHVHPGAAAVGGRVPGAQPAAAGRCTTCTAPRPT